MSFSSENHRRKISALIFCLLVVGFVGCIGNQQNNSQILIETAPGLEASTFREKCSICHGIEATGKILGGKQIPSLRDGEALKKSEEEIFKQIYNGGNGMLPFKDQLSEEKIRQMVRFVKHDIQGRE